MKKILFLIMISIAGLFTSCEKPPVFIPVRGNISGAIFDNNGSPLKGAQIEANFEAPENNSGISPPSTIVASTNSEGAYELNEVWDQVSLSISQIGFQPVFEQVELVLGNANLEADFTLVGSPTVQSVSLSKTVLAVTEPDTITIRVEAQDLFNSNFGAYTGKLLLKNETGGTEVILTAMEEGQSNTQYLFAANLFSGQLPAGVYQAVAEVTDPDGNFHQAPAAEEIRVE